MKRKKLMVALVAVAVTIGVVGVVTLSRPSVVMASNFVPIVKTVPEGAWSLKPGTGTSAVGLVTGNAPMGQMREQSLMRAKALTQCNFGAICVFDYNNYQGAVGNFDALTVWYAEGWMVYGTSWNDRIGSAYYLWGGSPNYLWPEQDVWFFDRTDCNYAGNGAYARVDDNEYESFNTGTPAVVMNNKTSSFTLDPYVNNTAYAPYPKVDSLICNDGNV